MPRPRQDRRDDRDGANRTKPQQRHPGERNDEKEQRDIGRKQAIQRRARQDSANDDRETHNADCGRRPARRYAPIGQDRNDVGNGPVDRSRDKHQRQGDAPEPITADRFTQRVALGQHLDHAAIRRAILHEQGDDGKGQDEHQATQRINPAHNRYRASRNG